MSYPTSESSKLFALLIGIDYYLPNELPDGGYYPSLGGCFRDVNLVEDFLQLKLGLPKERLFKLTSSRGDSVSPVEAPELLPTHKNIILAFKNITQVAQSGDQIYIHCSCHGGRAVTAYEDLKGPNGLDEALVPMDIGNSESNYVRDLEIAQLLKAMVDKGILTTIVLDCCHSGGATRGDSGAAVRGIANSRTGIDSVKRKPSELVAPMAELSRTWESLAVNRKLVSGSGWLLEPQGYVLLAACRASESANEYPFEGDKRNGALTYWLLDTLKQIGPGLSYKMLYDRILAKIHSQFPEQTPQLEGEKDRVVFGSERVKPTYAVPVIQVDEVKEIVQLNGGQANGLRKGAKFAIYPLQTQDFTQVDKRIALVEVDSLGATDSWATITKHLLNQKIEQGSPAVLLDLGSLRLQRTIKVLIFPSDKKSNTDLNKLKQGIEHAIDTGRKGFIRLSAQQEPGDFQVAINSQTKEYEVWDSAGNKIANLNPPISLSDVNGATCISDRLVHLAKYRNIQELDNNDPLSPLVRKLQVELIGVESSDYDPVDKPNPRPFEAGDMPTVNEGEWVFLRVKNNLRAQYENDPDAILNVTILDLQPEWGIEQIYPAGAANFEPFDPGHELILPLNCVLPKGYKTGVDTIKVFATKGATSFRWLEMSALDKPVVLGASGRDAVNPLEQLLSAFAENRNDERAVNPAEYPSKEWTMGQVQIRINAKK